MSINRISLYHLETLIWIARLGTFAAAAEHLNTTQPTISARMNELEARLGAQLFQKTGRLMMLTPAGRALVREYQPIWEQLQSALLRSAKYEKLTGVVRMGAGEIAAATCLPLFIAQLRGKWPELTVEIEIELTAQMLQNLLNGKIDIAFAAGSVAHPGLQSHPIGAVELLWVASPAAASRLRADRDGAPSSLWSLPKHSPLYAIVQKSLPRLGIGPTMISLCNNVRTIIDIVTMGDGFALVPRSMVHAQLNSGTLKAVFTDCELTPLVFHVVARATESEPVVQEVLRQAESIELDFGSSPESLN